MEQKSGKVIAFHSYKGGTGKSFLSLNIAASLACYSNQKIALLDYDFRAPTLFHKLLPKEVDTHWLNDYLDGKVSFENVLVDYSQYIGSKSTFFVAFASAKTRDMQEMQVKTRQWQQRALTLLMRAIVDLKNKFDFIILDSSPGVTYDSLNAMSSSDAVILVSTPDHVDFAGTTEMCLELWPSLIKFGAKPNLVLNKVPRISLDSEEIYKAEELETLFLESNDIPIISRIPIYCDKSVLTNKIFILEYPNHPLTSYINNLAEIFLKTR